MANPGFSNFLQVQSPNSMRMMDGTFNPSQASLFNKLNVAGPPAPSQPGFSSVQNGQAPSYGSFQPGYAQPLQTNSSGYGLDPAFADRVWGYRVQQNQNQSSSQQPTNVLNVLPQLSQALGGYQNYANGILGQVPQNLQGVNLNTGFKGAQDFQNGLQNGIDYFGKLGISQGLQNINLQRDAANNQIASTLGRTPGNDSLINVLQGQNAFRSQLAGQPLISDAQQGTAQRLSDMINLQNQVINSQNQTQLQQAGFNNQNAMNQFQAALAAGQPYQNLLDILSNLQGQGRGVVSNEIGFGSSTK